MAFTTLIYRRSKMGKGRLEWKEGRSKGNIGQRPSKFDSNRAAERNINRIGKFVPSFAEEYRCSDRLKLQAVAFLGEKNLIFDQQPNERSVDG